MLNNITYKKILAATIDKLRTHNVTWLLAMNTAVLLGTLFAPMYFVVIALCILRREKLIAVWCDFLDRPFPWLPVLPLLIYPIWAIKNGGFPPSDDLLRHVTSWSHGYDYNKIYHNLKEVIPHKSMWWAFELLTGKINSSLGLWPSVFIVQGASYIIMSIICIALARKLIPKTDGQAIIKQTLMVCLIISTGLFFRSTLARPEVFLTFWALSALLLPVALWTIIGIFLMPAYWLAFIYIPAALLLNASMKEKISSMLAIGIVFFIFWSLYAGHEWVANIISIKTYSEGRLLPPGESKSIFGTFFSPIFIAMSGLYIFLANTNKKSRHNNIIIVIIWFMLPNQMRYSGIISTLLIILLFKALPESKLSPQNTALSILFAFSLVYMQMPIKEKNTDSFPNFKIPEKAIVLTQFAVTSYVLPAINPSIRIAPSMESGAFKMETQRLAFDISNGRAPDCHALKAQGFTHVVEASMNELAPCLQIVGLSHGWRLWLVK